MSAYVHQSNHYIDNSLFFQHMVKRKLEVTKAIAENKPIPPVNNYISECFIKIATHLSYKPNFNGYTFRDEFILSGIEQCLKKVDKFSPEISNNPFFFSQE